MVNVNQMDGKSTAGQVIALAERGYTRKEIALELRIPKPRVEDILRRAANKGGDSRRIFEIWEMQVEMLAILREMQTTDQAKRVGQRMRSIEQRLPHLLGRAVEEEIRGSSPPDTSV